MLSKLASAPQFRNPYFLASLRFFASNRKPPRGFEKFYAKRPDEPNAYQPPQDWQLNPPGEPYVTNKPDTGRSQANEAKPDTIDERKIVGEIRTKRSMKKSNIPPPPFIGPNYEVPIIDRPDAPPNKPITKKPLAPIPPVRKMPQKSLFELDFLIARPGRRAHILRLRPFRLFFSILGLYLLWSFLSSGKPHINLSRMSTEELMRAFIVPGLVAKLVIEMPRLEESSESGLYTVRAYNQDGEELASVRIPEVQNFLETVYSEQMLANRDNSHLVEIEYRYEEEKKGGVRTVASFIWRNLYQLLKLVLVLSLISVFYRYLRKKPGSKSSGGSDLDLFGSDEVDFKVYGTDIKIDTRFKDVAGLTEAKKEILEFVEFLKNPGKFLELGAKIPKGALLVGPPGTGKTLLAKATAGEAGVPFFSVSGSDFVEMYVGVGASRVRQLFAQAKERAPSIIFIDEIDAVGKKRHGRIGGNDEKDQTLNQLLVEMDGFSTDTKVMVLAGTNRKDVLDNALLRPGRFDRTIELTLPDIDSREEILTLHLLPLKLNFELSIVDYAKRIAALTPGFSGADLANLCNEAAILAARRKKEWVDKEDFESSVERVIGGLERSKKLSEKEKRIVAYHESGHAVAAWFLEGADPVLKVSILPRSKGALGFAQFLPHESLLYSKNELLDKICATLAGRVAEELFFEKVTTGAQNDLQKATEIAMGIVTAFGMSERMGPIGYSLDKEMLGVPFSQATNKIIDEEVRSIIQSCLSRTRQLLAIHKPQVEKLAQLLIAQERVLHKDLESALGLRPFPIKAEYEKYAKEEGKPSSS